MAGKIKLLDVAVFIRVPMKQSSLSNEPTVAYGALLHNRTYMFHRVLKMVNTITSFRMMCSVVSLLQG